MFGIQGHTIYYVSGFKIQGQNCPIPSSRLEQISPNHWVLSLTANNDWTRFNLPPDGLPSRDDWLQCFESMIFSGINLNREPIDGCLPFPEGQGLTCGSNRYPNLFQNLSRGKGLLAVQIDNQMLSKTYQGARTYLQFK